MECWRAGGENVCVCGAAGADTHGGSDGATARYRVSTCQTDPLHEPIFKALSGRRACRCRSIAISAADLPAVRGLEPEASPSTSCRTRWTATVEPSPSTAAILMQRCGTRSEDEMSQRRRRLKPGSLLTCSKDVSRRITTLACLASHRMLCPASGLHPGDAITCGRGLCWLLTAQVEKLIIWGQK